MIKGEYVEARACTRHGRSVSADGLMKAKKLPMLFDQYKIAG